MRMTYISEEKERHKFVALAATAFADNDHIWTYTEGEIKPGELFAVRWGTGEDCVLVFRVGNDEPIIYQNVIHPISCEDT